MAGEATQKLFEFLQQNQGFNRQIQSEFLLQLLATGTMKSKALRLLDATLSTRRQLSMDAWGPWFQQAASAEVDLSSFTGFCSFIGSSRSSDLFDALKKKEWGNKTAALLVRNLSLIARNPTLKRRFWRDLNPSSLAASSIRLPVDQVIITIFKKLKQVYPGEFKKVYLSSHEIAFRSINDHLKTDYPDAADMLLWDDLWLWGYATQHGTGNTRVMQWNENKYWMKFHAIPELGHEKFRECSKTFLTIVQRSS